MGKRSQLSGKWWCNVTAHSRRMVRGGVGEARWFQMSVWLLPLLLSLTSHWPSHNEQFSNPMKAGYSSSRSFSFIPSTQSARRRNPIDLNPTRPGGSCSCLWNQFGTVQYLAYMAMHWQSQETPLYYTLSPAWGWMVLALQKGRQCCSELLLATETFVGLRHDMKLNTEAWRKIPAESEAVITLERGMAVFYIRT